MRQVQGAVALRLTLDVVGFDQAKDQIRRGGQPVDPAAWVER